MATFNGEELIMTLDAPVNGVITQDVQQDWYKEWKIWAKDGNLRYPPAFFDSFGGNNLTTGIKAGAYLVFQNNLGWRIRASEADQTVYVVGNLTPANSLLPMVIPTIGGHTVLFDGLQPITQNVDTILDTVDTKITNVKFLVESLRPHHSGHGNIIYWNPNNGDDTFNSTTVAQAVKTFAQAHALAVSGNHDIIVCLSDGIGQTIVDETIEITKNYLFVRGAGRDFKWKPTSTTAPTIKINAVGVELSGMIVDTANTGGQSAIEVVDGADFFLVENVWSRDAQHAALHVNGSVVYGRVNGCFFSHSGADCIHLDGDVRHTRITNTELDASAGDGIHIEGTTARNNIIGSGVKIYASGGYGIQITDPATRNFIDSDVSLYDNALGDILDNGIDTVDEKSVSETELVDAVWNKTLP